MLIKKICLELKSKIYDQNRKYLNNFKLCLNFQISLEFDGILKIKLNKKNKRKTFSEYAISLT